MSDAHVFRAPRDSHTIDADRLRGYLATAGMTLDATRTIQQFATGLANINYRLRIDGRDVVLRRPPDGDLPPGAHDMKREHRVLSKLSKVFPPAPDSMHLCEDVSVIGVPFQIMEYRPGRVIKGDDFSFIGDDPTRARRTGEMLIDAMIALHGVDAAHAGLAELGRPDGFIARAVKGWRTRAERLEPQGDMNRLTREIGVWLEAQTTKERTPTLLHCDLKLDNCILDPETLELRAIVDWDMGTRGDPLFDLATMTSYWTEAGDPECMHEMAQMPTAAPGFRTRDEIVARYASLTGRDVSDFPVLRVLCMFKLATVFHQLFATYGRGPDAQAAYHGLDRLAHDMYAFTHSVMRDAG
ncbi:MAG: phosphotransferase family protein [Hyphomicrobiaceae bacterium]